MARPHSKIYHYWVSKAGLERLGEIDRNLGTSLKSRIASLDHSDPNCWGCRRKRSSWRSLERCHIIPKSANGPDVAANLILMCRRCHVDSPTISDPNALWLWLDDRQHYRAELGKWIEERAQGDVNKRDELLNLYHETWSDPSFQLVEGGASSSALIACIKAKLISARQDPIKNEGDD
jgi:hypothetical protein